MLRHERMLELHDRQYQYQWRFNEELPSSIKGETIKDLPPNEQLQAEKYQGIKHNIFLSKFKSNVKENTSNCITSNYRKTGVNGV